MAIPGPGVAISMNTIATEFGGTVPHSLSEYYRGGGLVPNTPGNAAIPTSGQIAMGNFYGSANRTQVALTISGNTYNYDVYNNRGPTYVAGATDLTVTVNPGVTVGSTSTGTYAMLVPSSFSPGDTVTIVNNGVIQGMGGAGGTSQFMPGGPPTAWPGSPGAGGGSALYVNRPTTVTNNGTVASGGGGGGGGVGIFGNTSPKVTNVSVSGGGGGGGSGFNGGAGGTAGNVPSKPTDVRGSNGSSGSSPAGGGGGPGGVNGSNIGGPGGAGGGRGAGGANGSTGSYQGTGGQGSGGSGGGAGNYIVGNPFVTWPVTGTRQGNVA